MAKRKQDEDEEQLFSGKFDIKAFDAAAAEIEESRQISKEQTHELLRQAIDKACRDTLYPNPKTTNAKDMHSETVIDEATGQITFYECKDVTDDVEDDLYQIEPEDAQAIDPNLKVGDVLKIKHPWTDFDFSFFTRAIQNFMQKIKEATKQALIDKYSDRIGQIITGVVEKVDGGFTTLTVNKISTILSPQNTIPGEKFVPGDTVKVLLKGIGSADEGGDRATSLLVTRVDDNFLRRLFEQNIPDIADGSVVINGIVREAGNRAKVAVSSPSPDVDPTGACIGSDGSRIKDICAQLANEKIDVIKYQDNPYLYIAEALKPATVVGVILKDDEPVEEGKAPKAIAIVKNAESKIAIGKKGVNVRLASRLTGYSIDIKEQDAAMAEHLSYTNIDDIRRKIALARLDEETAQAPEETAEAPVEEQQTVEAQVPEESLATAEAEKKVEEAQQAAKQAPEAEAAAPVAAPAPAEVAAPAAPVAAPAPVAPAPKPEPKPEHVEINLKAKVSLSKLEQQIEEEKKNKNRQAPAYHKFHKEDKKEDEEKSKKPAVTGGMAIYTEEELKQIEKEEQEAQNKDNQVNTEDLDQYDDDQYYADDDKK